MRSILSSTTPIIPPGRPSTERTRSGRAKQKKPWRKKKETAGPEENGRSGGIKSSSGKETNRRGGVWHAEKEKNQ